MGNVVQFSIGVYRVKVGHGPVFSIKLWLIAVPANARKAKVASVNCFVMSIFSWV
jgi:hypothetical protein